MAWDFTPTSPTGPRCPGSGRLAVLLFPRAARGLARRFLESVRSLHRRGRTGDLAPADLLCAQPGDLLRTDHTNLDLPDGPPLFHAAAQYLDTRPDVFLR